MAGTAATFIWHICRVLAVLGGSVSGCLWLSPRLCGIGYTMHDAADWQLPRTCSQHVSEPAIAPVVNCRACMGSVETAGIWVMLC